MDYNLPGSSVQGISQAKNTGVGFHFLLQEIFTIQGLNLHLLHWQMDSLPLSHQGNPSTELEYSYLIPGFDDRCACSNLLDGPQVQNSFKGFQMWGNLRKSNDLLKRNKKTTSIDCDFLTVCSVQFSHSVVSNSL